MLTSYTRFEGNSTLGIWGFSTTWQCLLQKIPLGEFTPAHVASARTWRRAATFVAVKVKHSSNPQHGLKTFTVILTFTGRRWDATSLILSTQPLSKAAICFDWHSFVREERQCADSRWCKRRARNTFLSAVEEQIIFHCILQKRLRNLEALKCSVAPAAHSIYWQWCFPAANLWSLLFYCVASITSICYLADRYLVIATYVFFSFLFFRLLIVE